MKWLAILALPALVGCMDERQGGPDGKPGRQCRAEAAESFVGRHYAPGTGERIRRRTGSAAVRVLHPGDAATMDYRVDRVNVTLDARNDVTSVRCG